MRVSTLRGLIAPLVISSTLLAAQACAKPEPPMSRLNEIASQVQKSVGDWVALDPDQLFDTQSIFDYIDGHAEVYLAYSMRQCLARRFSGPDSDIVLDIFEMASAGDAFGVFTYDLDGEDVGIGQGSRFRYGWLSFWKGPFFVSVYADGEGPAVEEAVLDLGRSVAHAISETGEMPALVLAMPQQGLDRSSLRYLYHPQILSTHTTIPLDNPLGISVSTPAVLAQYNRSGRKAQVLVVSYPGPQEAEAGLQSAEGSSHRNKIAATDMKIAEKLHGARLAGRTLIVVLQADDQTIVEELLAAMPMEEQP